MPSVGGITCDFVHGSTPPSQKLRVETWQVPGLDGYGAQTLGLGDSEFRYTVVRYGSGAFVDTWFSLIEAFQGTIQTIVDDWGISRDNLLIERVSRPRKRAAVQVGQSIVAPARGELELLGKVLATPPPP